MEWTLFSFEILSRAAMDRNDLKKNAAFTGIIDTRIMTRDAFAAAKICKSSYPVI